jgi:hypothetical protein
MLYKYNGNYELPQAEAYWWGKWGIIYPVCFVCSIFKMEHAEQVEHVYNEPIVNLHCTIFGVLNTIIKIVIICKLSRYVF